MGWASEQLFFSGDRYFAAIEEALSLARATVEIEVYIFATDSLGQRVVSALCDAAMRGVSVRLIVDGIGSPSFAAAYGEELARKGIAFRIFHRAPWEYLMGSRSPGRFQRAITRLFQRINRRNHRKVFIIDSREAFVGGMNVWDVHLQAVQQDRAWRDTGVRVSGPGIALLQASFELHWGGRFQRVRAAIARLRERLRLLPNNGATHAPIDEDVLVNTLRWQRKANVRAFVKRIESVRTEILVTSGYFVPPPAVVSALCAAAKRGVRVRLLLGGESDIIFMPWVARTFYRQLLMAGVQIFEYQGAVLHAKSVVVDDWSVVGSSNLNHRSLLHDVEADVVLRSSESIRMLRSQFEEDLQSAVPISVEMMAEFPWWKRSIGYALLAIRWFL